MIAFLQVIFIFIGIVIICFSNLMNGYLFESLVEIDWFVRFLISVKVLVSMPQEFLVYLLFNSTHFGFILFLIITMIFLL